MLVFCLLFLALSVYQAQAMKCPKPGTNPCKEDCSMFFNCNQWGGGKLMPCPEGLEFNHNNGVCDWPHNTHGESCFRNRTKIVAMRVRRGLTDPLPPVSSSPLEENWEAECQTVGGYVVIGIENSKHTTDAEFKDMKKKAKELIMRLPIGKGKEQTRIIVKTFGSGSKDILGSATTWIEEKQTSDQLDKVFDAIQHDNTDTTDLSRITQSSLDALEPFDDFFTSALQIVLFFSAKNDGRLKVLKKVLLDSEVGYTATIHGVLVKPVSQASPEGDTITRIIGVFRDVMFLESDHVVRDAHLKVMDLLIRNCLACPSPPKLDVAIVLENYITLPRQKEGLTFRQFKNIINDGITRFQKNGFKDIQYGVVYYSDKVNYDYNLAANRTCNVKRLINKIPYESSDKRDLGSALKFAVENTLASTEARSDAKKIILIISSLMTFDADVAKYAKAARDKGMIVMIFSDDSQDRANINKVLTQMTYSIGLGSTFLKDDFVRLINQKTCILGRYF